MLQSKTIRTPQCTKSRQSSPKTNHTMRRQQNLKIYDKRRYRRQSSTEMDPSSNRNLRCRSLQQAMFRRSTQTQNHFHLQAKTRKSQMEMQVAVIMYRKITRQPMWLNENDFYDFNINNFNPNTFILVDQFQQQISTMETSQQGIGRKDNQISKENLSSSKKVLSKSKSHKRSSYDPTQKKVPMLESDDKKLLKSQSCTVIKQVSKMSNSASKSKSKSKSKSIEKQKKNHYFRNKTLDSESAKNMKTLTREELFQYGKKVRKSNRKYVDTENSSQNLQMRMPWGVDEARLNNYVLETLAKMQKMRRAQCQKRSDTFQTEHHQSDIKTQLTPKKPFFPNSKLHGKQSETVIKSPGYEQEKTNKKEAKHVDWHKGKKIQLSEATQKQKKKHKASHVEQEQAQQHESEINESVKISEKITKLLNGEFQCLEKNSFYTLNFRVVNRKIIELQLAFHKKVQLVVVNLLKGSLQCQSIHEEYKDVSAKTSIILMTAVNSTHKHEAYSYPQMQIQLTDKSSSLSLHKKILLPYSYLFFLEVVSTENLKSIKSEKKIKNKSVLEDIAYSKSMLLKMEKIFDNNFIKFKIKDHLFYLYGFHIWGELCLVRVIVSGAKCLLECECCALGITQQVLQMFRSVLGV